MKKLKIGLLPLYLELYDEFWSDMRNQINGFYEKIADRLMEKNLDVLTVPVCRIKPEFEKAVKLFEDENVDAIITLHLAYSPSLESIDVLASTKLPVIILDTTEAFDFSNLQDPGEISFNHGIHGVQDMCNLLIRKEKHFFINAGHWERSDVIDRTISCVYAAKIAGSIRSARVGRIGEAFKGMGDFGISSEVLKSTIGIDTVVFDHKLSDKLISDISKKEINNEKDHDYENFIVDVIDEELYEKTIITSIAVRKWIEKENLSAVTINFLAAGTASGLPCMPFIEASKAMARGIGYAGEGDVLTAALTGALLSVYPQTSFVEMFCPDWKNNSIFLSHMGEMNISLAAEKPHLAVKEFVFTDAADPVVAYGRFKPGNVVFVNIAPGKNNTYSLIVSSGEMLDIDSEDKMRDTIHGWFRPSMDISDFLERYSMAGGTHHAVLVYGDRLKEIIKFGDLMSWKIVEI